MSLGGAIIPGGIQGVLAASVLALPEAVLATARGLGSVVNAVSDGVETIADAVDDFSQSMTLGSSTKDLGTAAVQEPIQHGEEPAKSMGFQVAEVNEADLGGMAKVAEFFSRPQVADVGVGV